MFAFRSFLVCCLRCAKKHILIVLISVSVVLLCIQVLVLYSISIPNEAAQHDGTKFIYPRRYSLAKLRALRRLSKFTILHSRSSRVIPRDGAVEFVLVIPHGLQPSQEALGLTFLPQKDLESVLFLEKVLGLVPDIDGAACLPGSPRTHHRVFTNSGKESSSKFDVSSLNNSSWCRFSKRDWSLQILNTGETRTWKWTHPKPSNLTLVAQMCNILRGPFLIRKEKLLGNKSWRPQFGKASILDFFLRSRGELKIAKIANCFMSDSLYKVDRADNEGLPNFREYADLRIEHGILRIIQEDRIEWTTCVANGVSCREEPYTPLTSLPEIGLPVCCSVVLGRMLKDVVHAMDAIGLEYRIVYGTLLGGARSNAIIPWTYDIDIAIRKTMYDNSTVFRQLQEQLSDKYDVGFYEGMRRAIALYPPYIDVNTAPFFNGPDDLQGNQFFSNVILDTVDNMRWNEAFSWRSRGYVDFNPGPRVWWDGHSYVTINGESYVTVKNPDVELRNWYGARYKTPIRTGTDWRGLSDEGAA